MPSFRAIRERDDGQIPEYNVSVLYLGNGLGIGMVGDELTLFVGRLQDPQGGEDVPVGFYELQLTQPLDETYGGTGLASFAQGSILHASGANTWAALAKGAEGTIPRAGAATLAYTSFTIPATVAAGLILYASASNVLSAVEVTEAVPTTFDAGTGSGAWAPNKANGPMQRRVYSGAGSVTAPTNFTKGTMILFITGGGFQVDFNTTDFEGPELSFPAAASIIATIAHKGTGKLVVTASEYTP